MCVIYTTHLWFNASKHGDAVERVLWDDKPLELQELWWPELKQRPLAEWRTNRLEQLGRQLNQWPLKPSATEGYRTAEVTLGGVDTDHLSSRTMEAKNVSGLYFIGEVLDVTGHLGGFNFQWAWASGFSAGLEA